MLLLRVAFLVERTRGRGGGVGLYNIPILIVCELRRAPAVCAGVRRAPDGGLAVPVAARVLDLVVLTHCVCVYACALWLCCAFASSTRPGCYVDPG